MEKEKLLRILEILREVQEAHEREARLGGQVYTELEQLREAQKLAKELLG